MYHATIMTGNECQLSAYTMMLSSVAIGVCRTARRLVCCTELNTVQTERVLMRLVVTSISDSRLCPVKQKSVCTPFMY